MGCGERHAALASYYAPDHWQSLRECGLVPDEPWNLLRNDTRRAFVDVIESLLLDALAPPPGGSNVG